MIFRTPGFWYEKSSLWPVLLSPLGYVYAFLARQRFDMHYPVPLLRPVICVGNLVAGGAGKTPVVMSLVRMLQEKGLNPHILTRGYGGAERGPLQVSPGRDTSEDVGDEALLLVDIAPTWVSKSRPHGAQEAIDSGANVIVMDDGFQNPSLYKDFSLLVFDGNSGIGNGHVMPAGPLRENFSTGLARADAAVIIGEDKGNVSDLIRKESDMPIFQAKLQPSGNNPDIFGKEVFAFAGIGRPEKFRDSLVAAGAVIDGWAEFPDHYPYAEDDLKELLSAAKAKQSIVLTTAKDYVRLPQSCRDQVLVFAVDLVWENADDLVELILQAVRDENFA